MYKAFFKIKMVLFISSIPTDFICFSSIIDEVRSAVKETLKNSLFMNYKMNFIIVG